MTQWLIDAYGWRGTWRVLALFFLVVSVPAAALFLRRQPEDMGLQVDGDPPPDSSDPGSAASPAQPADPEVTWTVREAFRTVTMWKLIAVFALSGVAQGGASFHRIPYFVEKAYDPLTVSWSFAADAGAAAATSLVETAGCRNPHAVPGCRLVRWFHHRHSADDLRVIRGNDVPVHHNVRQFGGRGDDCTLHLRRLLRPRPIRIVMPSNPGIAGRRGSATCTTIPAPAGLVDPVGHLRGHGVARVTACHRARGRGRNRGSRTRLAMKPQPPGGSIDGSQAHRIREDRHWAAAEAFYETELLPKLLPAQKGKVLVHLVHATTPSAPRAVIRQLGLRKNGKGRCASDWATNKLCALLPTVVRSSGTTQFY